MQIDLGDKELRLLENQPLRISRAAGTQLMCTAGQLWVTESGRYEDSFLNPGDVYLVTGNSLVLIEAVGMGKLLFTGRRRASSMSTQKVPGLLDAEAFSWFNSRLSSRKGG